MAHRVNRTSHDLVECRVLHSTLSRLEPCAVKVACTVLRGRGGGNATSLPDSSHIWSAPHCKGKITVCMKDKLQSYIRHLTEELYTLVP